MADNNAVAPHVVYVGEAVGSAGMGGTLTSAVNDESLRVLAGEEDIAEQLGTFKVGLASDAGDLQSTGVLDSYGYERNLIGSSLQFKTSIAGVATQSIDKVVGLSGGGVVENEGAIDIGDEGEDGDEAVVFAPEPTVIVKGGFVVDANGSVLGQTSSGTSSLASKRPSRPAASPALPKRPSRQPPETPLTQQKRGRGLTLGQLMGSSSTSSRGRVTRTRADASWINDAKKDDDDADDDNLSLDRKKRDREGRRGRGQNKKYDD